MQLFVNWLRIIIISVWIPLAVSCDIYLYPSTIVGAGRGIVAGRSFGLGETIETSGAITYSHEYCVEGCQLNNYAYSTEQENYSMIILGAGVLYNHKTPKSVDYYWSSFPPHDPSVQTKAYTQFTQSTFTALESLTVGQEMFVDYGNNWLLDRQLVDEDTTVLKSHNNHDTNCSGSGTFDTPADMDHVTHALHSKLESEIPPTTLISVDDLKKHGHCLSDVYEKESAIPHAGRGLFTRKSYKIGDIVTISPVLTLSRHMVEQTVHDSVLMNYCITLSENKTDMVLFPLTNANFINHASDAMSNVKIQWYDWSTSSSIPVTNGMDLDQRSHSSGHNNKNNIWAISEKLKLTPEQLFDSPFAPLDIAYIATREIQSDEELTINYGLNWLEAWNVYQNSVVAFEGRVCTDHDLTCCSSKGDSVEKMVPPMFRHFIELEHEFMFPPHWRK